MPLLPFSQGLGTSWTDSGADCIPSSLGNKQEGLCFGPRSKGGKDWSSLRASGTGEAIISPCISVANTRLDLWGGLLVTLLTGGTVLRDFALEMLAWRSFC